ncbi:MAG: sugar phosphate isomerase/epimerase family protein [Chitinophagaceae bacterium]
MKILITCSAWLLLLTACNNNQAKTGEATADAAGNAGWKTGVALYSFHQLPYSVAIEKVDSADIRYVEGFSFYKLGNEYKDTTMGDLSPEAIQKMKEGMKNRDIQMVSMYVAGGNNVDEWKRTFDLAKAFNLEFVTSEPPKEQWDMVDSLAGVYNIKVALHNHWKEISIYWHPDSVLAAVKSHPNFGACADVGHWVRSGLEPSECLKKLEGHILGMHLKDVDSLGVKDARDMNVGTGVIDFNKVVAELKRQQYKGMIYVECEHNFDNNLPDIRQSLEYFNKLSAR